YKNPEDAKQALEKMNGFELAGRTIKVGLVTDKSSGMNLNLDDGDVAGLALNAQSRVELMQKLARDTDLIAPTTAPVLSEPPKPVQPRVNPTRCVLLKNMFNPEDETESNWAEELEDDVKTECEKFGTVVHISVDKESEGDIYMKFDSVPAAQNAVNGLNGRWFGGNQISAVFILDMFYNMLEVEDATIKSSEFSSQAPADSLQSDTKIQTFSGDLDKVINEELVMNTDRCHIRQTRKIIRYTKEELLALRLSPLVKPPDALPPISSWFGEPVIKKESRKNNNTDGSQESEKSKQNSHNLGEGLSKAKDDSNTLGIPESPLLGVSRSPNGSEPTSPRPSGLKNTEDKIAQVRTNRSEGLRQRQEDVSFSRTGVKDFEVRAPRGPTGGRGFVGREALRDRTLTEKTLKEQTGSLHNTHGRGFSHSRSHETTRNNRRDGGISGKDHLGRANNYSRHQHSEEKSETPEWMNYNPHTDEDSKHGENGEDSLQNGSKDKSSSDFDESSRNLSNVDQLFGPGGIDLNSSAFDKFLSQHNLAMAEDNVSKVGPKSAEVIPREQGTSRFARFFTNSDIDKESQESGNNGRRTRLPMPTQGQIQNTSSELKSISIDALFQSQAAVPPISPRITPNDGTRMLSGMLTEDEVLKTLGAKPAHKPENKERNYEDEAAMNKIYAALKKGPSSEVPRQNSPNVPSSSNQPQQHSTISQSGLPFNDPSIVSTQKSNPMGKSGQQHLPKVDASNKHLGFSELPPTDSAKKINMLFGGNVPTSVYRQLSSRSDNGSRESSAASSPALKFNAKPNISNFPHSPQSSAHVHDIHAPIFKSPPPRSPVLPHQSHNHSPYHNVVPPYSNGPSIPQHTNNRQEYPPPVGRNIPVEQLFGMMPPRNVSQQIHPQFPQPLIPVSMPPPLPYGLQHQPQLERYSQQPQFTGAPIPQHLSVHHHPGVLPPGTEALFANMHGYAQFIPNLVNNAMTPNNIPGIPNNSNLQQRGMMTLEEIERRSLGGR
ncbi:13186_t:CDS:10, partial [Acaulospora colombiana]